MKHNTSIQDTGITLSMSEISFSHASAAALTEFNRKREWLAQESGGTWRQLPEIKVGLIDHDPDQQSRTQGFLEQYSPEVQFIGAFVSSEKACIVMEDNGIKLDVMIISVDALNPSSLDHVRTVKNRLPKTQVLMLMAEENGDLIFKCLLAGASGYVLQERSNANLVQALRDVTVGGAELNSHIAKKVVHFFQKRTSSATAAVSVAALSEREREVLEHLAKSLAYKEIAVELGISVETVRRHCHNIYEKMHVSSRTEAVQKFSEQ